MTSRATSHLVLRATIGGRRVRESLWSIGQSALAGALAWEAASRVLHHGAPFFAAVAGIICLSISYQNRLRRVGEVAVGVAVGVGLGDVIVHQIGRGGWQLGLVVLLAMSVGLFIDGAPLIVNQAALQAVFVAVLPPPAGGYVGRWEDALLGGATALTIAFVLPSDPRPAPRRTIRSLTQSLAHVLREAANASREGDAERAAAALDEARGTQRDLELWSAAVHAGEEISRLSPLRRRARTELAAHRQALAPVDRAVRNMRVAVRRVNAAIDEPEPIPGAVLDCLDDVAGALHTLPGALLDSGGEGHRRAIAALQRAADLLDTDALAPPSMSATVVVAQLRSAVVDLLQAVGVSQADARASLPH